MTVVSRYLGICSPPWSSTDCDKLSYFRICSAWLCSTTDSNILRSFGISTAPLWSTTNANWLERLPLVPKCLLLVLELGKNSGKNCTYESFRQKQLQFRKKRKPSILSEFWDKSARIMMVIDTFIKPYNVVINNFSDILSGSPNITKVETYMSGCLFTVKSLWQTFYCSKYFIGIFCSVRIWLYSERT